MNWLFSVYTHSLITLHLVSVFPPHIPECVCMCMIILRVSGLHAEVPMACFLCRDMLYLQKMCVLVCVSVCTDTVTSSVLRDSPGATYGCFYRGCINWDIAVNINVSPWRLYSPPAWMLIKDTPRLWPCWQGSSWQGSLKGRYCHYCIKAAGCWYLAPIELTVVWSYWVKKSSHVTQRLFCFL